MSIELTCTTCGKRLLVVATGAGKRIRCPQCKELLAVPAPEHVVESAPPTAEVTSESPIQHAAPNASVFTPSNATQAVPPPRWQRLKELGERLVTYAEFYFFVAVIVTIAGFGGGVIAGFIFENVFVVIGFVAIGLGAVPLFLIAELLSRANEGIALVTACEEHLKALREWVERQDKAGSPDEAASSLH